MKSDGVNPSQTQKTHLIFAPISSDSKRFLRNILEICTNYRVKVTMKQDKKKKHYAKIIGYSSNGGEDRKNMVWRGLTPAGNSRVLRTPPTGRFRSAETFMRWGL